MTLRRRSPENVSLERLEKMWVAKEKHCLHIHIGQAEESTLRNCGKTSTGWSRSIHEGRYPFNNLLY